MYEVRLSHHADEGYTLGIDIVFIGNVLPMFWRSLLPVASW